MQGKWRPVAEASRCIFYWVMNKSGHVFQAQLFGDDWISASDDICNPTHFFDEPKPDPPTVRYRFKNPLGSWCATTDYSTGDCVMAQTTSRADAEAVARVMDWTIVEVMGDD